MSVYLIGAISVNDLEAYTPYMEGAFAVVQQYGIEPLAYGAPAPIEGESPAERIILLKFKDQAALDSWYKSPEYQAIVPIRWKNADTAFICSLPGLDEA